jgi:translation elongation factor EF-1alpha
MKEIGKVFDYYKKIEVIAIKVNGGLKKGDTIKIKGGTTDFEQKVESMQIEHDKVEEVKAGDDVGIKVKKKCRKGDVVYKVE